MNAVSLNAIILWIDLHLRPHIIELHIRFSNRPAPFDCLNAFLEVVGRDGSGCDGGF